MDVNATAAYAKWQTQLAAMTAAIADLKLPPISETYYGSDIDIDFDDEVTSGSDDFVSYNTSEEDDWSSDQSQLEEFGPEWLQMKCASLGLSGDLQDQITALLASDSADDELQSTLTDLIGFDGFDLIIELISHRREITRPTATTSSDKDGPFGKLQTKREREEVLRQRDFEHKNAQLGPALNRDGPIYPHVYTTHVAGNKLDSKGRQYALPVGHTRKEERFYEEYTIPAGKVGTIGKGRKLVEISDMDGLCRNTFKGYKNLNRMQSLVYPVAYQTSVNMLICAPTGAVSIIAFTLFLEKF